MNTDDIKSAIAKRFAEVNQHLGLGPKDYTAGAKVVFDDPEQPMVAVDCAGSGPLKGHVFKTRGIAELRQIILNDEPQDGAAVRKLQQLRQDLGDVGLGGLSPDQVAQPAEDGDDPSRKSKLEQLATLYAFGAMNVQPKELEDIDSVLFPSQVTAFTGDTLVLGPNTQLVIYGLEPIVFNFSYVEMHASSQIAVYSKVALFLGQVTVTGDPGEAPQIYVSGQPYSSPSAQTGATGQTPEQPKDAAAGEHEFDEQSGKFICTKQPAEGTAGAPGGIGGPGPKGGPGRQLQSANIDIYATEGPSVTIQVQGGCGQNGGQGGQGGDGGQGGFAGYVPIGCKPAKHGPQGPGGQGGRGGDGGDGSRSLEPIRIVQRETAQLKTRLLPGLGGQGGKGGAPGRGDGDGGTGPKGTDGAQGPTPVLVMVQSPN